MKYCRSLYGIIAVVMVAALCAPGCKKTDTLTSGGILTFSNDTLKFDTVFTSSASFTNAMVIYNPQNEAVVVSSIKMQNGAASYFHLNVDGQKTNTPVNLKIAPHDSIYVFATVNIDPTDTNTPFVINDALIATMNGRTFTVPFTAYGQNAHYMVSDSISTNITWLTDKPYVVIHNFVVGPAGTLNIPKGCRVYMHQDAQIIVYNQLIIGQSATTNFLNDSVVLQGDRLDRVYFGYVGYPGEWCGLWFVPGSSGHISHAVLKNCGGGANYYQYSIIPAAIRVDTAAYLSIDHSIIENSYSIGILGFQGSIHASDCNINTTGQQAVTISQGGTDTFQNCTFANYGTAQLNHADAGTLAILDYFSPDGTHYYYGNLDVQLLNCIVYGSLDSEVICDTTGSPKGTSARLVMDHCLLKMGPVREPFITFGSCIFNKDPLFKNSATGDFHLLSGSPAIGSANSANTLLDDLEGHTWTNTIGCYQYQ